MKASILLPVLLAILAGCDVKVSTNAKPAETKPAAIPHSDAVKSEAFEAAQSIVRSMDRGEYEKVWEDSSDAMKRETPKATFNTFMSAMRGSLGQPESRGAYRLAFTRSVDRLPEGDYVWVEVDTVYHGKTITEQIIMGREPGQWKLLGFFMEAKAKIKLFG